MSDDLEKALRGYRPAGPPARLREKILRHRAAPSAAARRRPNWLFRSAIAAVLLVSFGLIHVADRMNEETAARVGVGAARWTAEAEQAVDLLGSGSAGRRYIALCLMAGNGRTAPRPLVQGERR
jgi:hypothetical protein